jgi:hypothetical protein
LSGPISNCFSPFKISSLRDIPVAKNVLSQHRRNNTTELRSLEKLAYSVEVFDARDKVLGRESDLDVARAAFSAYAAKHPDKLILICWKAQILRRSDRPIS